MDNWKDILISTIVICSIFLLTDRILAYGLKEVVMLSNNRFSKLYAENINTDILIIGNSRGGNTFYAPEIERRLKVKAFNLSYNGLSLKIGNAIFMDFMDRNPPPKLLILEITNINTQDNLINNLKLYSNVSKRLNEILINTSPKAAMFMNISNLYAYNSEFFLRTMYYLFKSDHTWINEYQINMNLFKNYKPSEKDKRNFYPIKDNINDLFNILKICKEYDIEVKLIVGPFLPDHIKNIPEFTVWKKELSNILGPEYPIVDYSTTIKDYKYFADPVHLNKNGAFHLLQLMIEDNIFQNIYLKTSH